MKFNDNQLCIDLIDSKGAQQGKSGILPTLDDTANSGRNDANAAFLAQLNQSWTTPSRHPNFLTPRFGSDQFFGIRHYAGEVYYSIAGFVEKNKDSTNLDVKERLYNSTNPLLKLLMEDLLRANGEAPVTASGPSTAGPTSAKKGAGRSNSTAPASSVTAANKENLLRPAATSGRMAGGGAAGAVSKLKEDSISKQFVLSLKQLYETLDATEPHYIRCIKPNTLKLPDRLHGQQALEQLKYAGKLY